MFLQFMNEFKRDFIFFNCVTSKRYACICSWYLLLHLRKIWGVFTSPELISQVIKSLFIQSFSKLILYMCTWSLVSIDNISICPLFTHEQTWWYFRTICSVLSLYFASFVQFKSQLLSSNNLNLIVGLGV